MGEGPWSWRAHPLPDPSRGGAVVSLLNPLPMPATYSRVRPSPRRDPRLLSCPGTGGDAFAVITSQMYPLPWLMKSPVPQITSRQRGTRHLSLPAQGPTSQPNGAFNWKEKLAVCPEILKKGTRVDLVLKFATHLCHVFLFQRLEGVLGTI